MKTAGDVLSVLFDERLMGKAKSYSKLFDSWTEITGKNGIAAAASHSRIKELDQGILLVETDHPGWKQILQTKQNDLLNDFRRSFPEMEISGISLMLGRGEQPVPQDTHTAEEPKKETNTETAQKPPRQPDGDFSAVSGYGAIRDETLKEKLKNLERHIIDREQRGDTAQ